MKDLIIVGAGGFGREVSWLVSRINEVVPQWNLLGFLDSNSELQSKNIDKVNVIGTVEDIVKYPDAYVVCCVANTHIRRILAQKVGANRFATLIDPSAIISPMAEIGEGSVVNAGAVISVDVKIGKHNIIGVNSTVGHDDVFEDFVTLYPSVNVSGKALVKSGVELGTGTQVLQGHTIGENAIVGAGAVVVCDLPGNCTAVGVPAKVIKVNEKRC